MKSDTIAAISTALSSSGIGIVRISGEDAISVADRVFRSPSGRSLTAQKSHTIHYGHIYDGETVIDEVLVMLMRGPRSFTTEDTVEINCHGGVFVVKRVLETVLRNGARLAEPGEFTKRAFLGGRMDLTQAEAVMDLIQSQNEYALDASVRQLRGNVSDEIKEMRSQIIYEIAFIESALDDPEHISLDGYTDRLLPLVQGLQDRLSALIRSFDNGRQMTEGIKTVILGKPNAGKSSILNLLAGEERAIVTDIAGTTRDVLEENIVLDGISLRLLDTAGIRETEDVVESIGVERALKHASDADLILYVADAAAGLDDNDIHILESIQGKQVIALLNKTDRQDVNEELLQSISQSVSKYISEGQVVAFSAKERIGLTTLREKVSELFFAGKVSFNDQITITNVRHKDLLVEARESLKMVERSVYDEMPEDFYSIDLMGAYEKLGEIIGEEVGDDLVNEIFHRFCMGK